MFIAAPTPSPDPCDNIGGAAQQACRGGSGSGSSVPDPTGTLDPLTALAHKVADGAAWVVERVGKALDGTSNVDFTSTAFLQQYAIVFAASTFLTILLWLIAVTKRAMRGVPLSRAFGEAIGFLWMTVIASAFTPLTLQVLVSTVDGITQAVGGTDGSVPDLFAKLAEVMRQDGDALGGGPIILIIVAGATILVAGILALELALRAVALYLGALLGVVVYTGLVDRALWGKVRLWAGVMVALLLLEPVIVICLGIADVFTSGSDNDPAAVIVAGNVVVLAALAAGIAIFKFIPGYGDDIVSGLALRATATAGRGAVKVGASAAGIVSQGIQTHGGRQSGSSSGNRGGQGARKINGVNGVSDGISTHGSRGSGKKKSGE